VEADEGRLQQVLDTIVANALKYAPEGVIEMSQLLELGQLVAIENLAADHGLDHPEFDDFLKRVIACCVEVDLDGLGRLLRPADAAGSRMPADPRTAAGSDAPIG
jgi:signal transduction histidine kinase